MSGAAQQWWAPPTTAGAGNCDVDTATSTAFAASAVSRRSALKLLSALAAGTAVAGCEPPHEEIVAYADTPEGRAAGQPRYYATMLPLLGFGQPAVVETNAGRPTKIEGNARHAGSRGGSDAFSQAAVLSLYDPGRAKTPTRRGELRAWQSLVSELGERRQAWAETHGRGLRILTQTVTSPTLAAQISDLIDRYPEARWHGWDPVNADAARAGAKAAYGQPLDTILHLDRASIVVSLGADPLGPGAGQAIDAQGFAAARQARGGDAAMSRLYAIESGMSLTGAKADHRLALAPTDIAAFGRALARELGADLPAPDLPERARATLAAILDDLRRHGGRSVVVVGRGQPSAEHALGHWINHRIGATGRTLDFVPPISAEPGPHLGSIRDLAAALSAGDVSDLVLLGGNPAYDAPADVGFADLLANAPFSLHLSASANETSHLCTWHVPDPHPLETWSDARTADGATGIVQPVVRRFYDSHNGHELIAAMQGSLDASARDIVMSHWRQRHDGDDFPAWWRRTLQDGMVANSAAETVSVSEPALPTDLRTHRRPTNNAGHTIMFEPDAAVWDGRFAANAWLQELPRPFSKHVWGNAAGIAPADADTLAIEPGDRVRIRVADRAIEIPAMIVPGQAPGVVTLPLGYGRRQAGPIGTGVGTDVYPLRVGDGLWLQEGARVEPIGEHENLPATQHHHTLDGRDIVRTVTASDLRHLSARETVEPPSLYPEPDRGDGYAWGMVIDQTACIGCNTCVVACQAENNVPVVGPAEVARGRDMHWLRIDTYYRGPADAPDVAFQPVPCMHCELAPCEPVCPVEAAIHDSEGLNAQIYNRCVGTRFCQANCPYKVRRFNFFGYGDGQTYADLGDPSYHALHNPDVSVRARGVMEKCTYCVQRINAARRTAEVDGAPIRDGDMVTACQGACPTKAIHFGDLNDRDSDVARLKQQPHEYALLEHLGTRPRTTYLARVHNPNRVLEDTA